MTDVADGGPCCSAGSVKDRAGFSPHEVKVDRMLSELRDGSSIEYWGIATRRAEDGKYVSLANVDGMLCVVLVKITERDDA